MILNISVIESYVDLHSKIEQRAEFILQEYVKAETVAMASIGKKYLWVKPASSHVHFTSLDLIGKNIEYTGTDDDACEVYLDLPLDYLFNDDWIPDLKNSILEKYKLADEEEKRYKVEQVNRQKIWDKERILELAAKHNFNIAFVS